MQKLTNKEINYILKQLMINDLKELIHVGEGAWHEVYRIKTFSNQDFVIRIKKRKNIISFKLTPDSTFLQNMNHPKHIITKPTNAFGEYAPPNLNTLLMKK
ncbi:hypothetical protein [Bacillus fungorum]|uniref:hypothetical protein n=1 Tax=Bacillus fungorum TaxID=2039284 RepID=UPI001FEAB9E5|nr:hypothetical protein [Bacillus fungorum]